MNEPPILTVAVAVFSCLLFMMSACCCLVPQALRPDSLILMGKNTMMKRSIRLYCEETGNDQWAPILDQLVGNVGLVFTKGDLSQVRRGW